MDAFVSVADAIDRIAGIRHDRLTDADKQDADDVLEAAAAWATNGLPLTEFARVGTIPSPHTGRPSAGYTRYVALLSTPVTDPRRDALRRAIDALLDFQGLVITTTGIYERGDIVDIPIVYRRQAA